MTTVAASSSSSSGSPSVEFESSTLTPFETCACYTPTQQGCARPRRCQSCRLKRGCGINAFGGCMSQSEFSDYYGEDYRQAFAADLVLPNATTTNPSALADKALDWWLPSLEAKYCHADDAVCTRCISERFYTRNTWSDSRFCVGADSCVCIMNCEFPITSTKCATINTPTPVPSLSDSSASSGQERSQLAYLIVGPAVPTFMIWLAYMFRGGNGWSTEATGSADQRQQQREARAAQREQAWQHRLDTRGVGLVSLAGWNQHRKQAIDNEHATFNSVVYAPAPATPPPQQRDATLDSHV